MPTLNVSALLPSLARLSLRRTATGSGRGGGGGSGGRRALSLALDDAIVALPKTARRALSKVCVGFVAVSRLLYTGADGRREAVLFVEEFFVDEQQRGKGVGRCLLAYAMGLEDPNSTRNAGLVVRSADQQAKARDLYKWMGFEPAEEVPPFDVDDPDDAVVPGEGEAYWQAPIQVDPRKCVLQGQNATGHVYIKDTDIFLDCVRMDPKRFMAAYKPIVLMAEAHHTDKAGDHPGVENAEDDIVVMRGILENVTLGVYGAFVYE